MNNFNVLRTVREHPWWVAGASGTVALALAGCGSGNNSEKPPHPLTFDYLGGGSKVIKVYPGVENTSDDKKYNGTYLDGEQVLAECWTAGRRVESDPSLGELPRESNKWFRLDAEPTQYATAVYVKNPQKLLEQLAEC